MTYHDGGEKHTGKDTGSGVCDKGDVRYNGSTQEKAQVVEVEFTLLTNGMVNLQKKAKTIKTVINQASAPIRTISSLCKIKLKRMCKVFGLF